MQKSDVRKLHKPGGQFISQQLLLKHSILLMTLILL